MELLYMVRGGDGKDYGPVSLQQLTVWVKEGRLTPQQEVKRSDMEHSAPAKDFAELQAIFGLAAPPMSAASSPAAPPRGIPQENPAELYAKVKSDASWFYVMGGLSLVNTIMSFTGTGLRFAFGLGVSGLINNFASGLESSGALVALILNVIAAGIFLVLGLFAGRAHLWPFLTGIVLLALDGIPPLISQRWLSVIAHGIVLYFLFRGSAACRKLMASQAGGGLNP